MFKNLHRAHRGDRVASSDSVHMRLTDKVGKHQHPELSTEIFLLGFGDISYAFQLAH